MSSVEDGKKLLVITQNGKFHL